MLIPLPRLFASGVTMGLVAVVTVGIALAAQAPADPPLSCITDGTRVRHTYLRHADPDKLREAVRIFEQGLQGVDYPEGTVISAIPTEAMVKRSKGAFPDTNGWEFLVLNPTADGTTITQRGATAANRLGSCAGCHAAAAAHDFVCEQGHGCAPVPLTEAIVARLQAADARCAARK